MRTFLIANSHTLKATISHANPTSFIHKSGNPSSSTRHPYVQGHKSHCILTVPNVIRGSFIPSSLFVGHVANDIWYQIASGRLRDAANSLTKPFRANVLRIRMIFSLFSLRGYSIKIHRKPYDWWTTGLRDHSPVSIYKFGLYLQ